MKLFPLQILLFAQNKKAKKNVFLLVRFLLFLTAIIALYSVIFHLLMVYEGRNFSWITGLYWTLTVMSTLGFGDITFHTDLGLLFTLLVLLSGVVLLLIMLPFAFIQYFWAPWLEAQKDSIIPRSLPETMEDHVIITNFDPLTRNLVEKLKKHLFDYSFVCSDQQTAATIHDAGYNVVLGEIDAPETYEKMQADQAALIVSTADDLLNTNISFTVREISSKVPIACSADTEHSLDILNFPGNTHVFQFMRMLGVNMAQQSMPFSSTNIIGRFEELRVGEFPVRDTNLAGQTLAESRLRNKLGITVIGLLEKGKILPPAPQATLSSTNILIIAGTEDELIRAGEQLALPPPQQLPEPTVLILGGGRVGKAAAAFLNTNKIPYVIVEKRHNTGTDHKHHIHGDAADINILKAAGIDHAHSVIITPHNDAMNIYLSFYCRQLRPDIQIVSRATAERTVPKLHRAGADLVNSSASMGATSIMNILHPSDVSFFSDALNVFLVPTPDTFIGKPLTELKMREKTQCSLLAMKNNDQFITNPDPTQPLEKTDELILAGSLEAEELFRKEYLD
ncbi:MAG: NAD-binding protein [Thermodesulfobacteriota bacterium]|nr:NAD-binding protein [Thermodesulfobacteriota bacterium]